MKAPKGYNCAHFVLLSAPMRYQKIVSWLIREPEQFSLVPTFDKWILFFLKIIHLGIRLLVRLLLGKSRRDRLYIDHYIKIVPSVNPTVLLFFILCKITKYFQLAKKISVTINVPKYGYKVYCPVNKEDFINLTVREDEIIERFQPKQGDTVVDIGSNLGRYTLMASRRVGQTGKVIAVEAHPLNFQMLERNIRLNEFRNIIPLNYTAYSKCTRLPLYLLDDDSGTTHYSLVRDHIPQAKPTNTIEVNVDTIDNLLQSWRIGTVDWIKVDVEGAELEVLKGAKDTLSKNTKISIMVEVHNLSSGINLYEPIIKLLQSYGLKIVFQRDYESGAKHIIASKFH